MHLLVLMEDRVSYSGHNANLQLLLCAVLERRWQSVHLEFMSTH